MHERRKEQQKSQFHSRNKHQGEYNFAVLVKSCPELAQHIITNKYGKQSINFFDASGVKVLNRALLQNYYGIKNWNIPEGYLCPPIPGRAEYIHHIADLLQSDKSIKKGTEICCLDIGVGANCIYPIIGAKEYNWNFVGSDIDAIAIKSASEIIEADPELRKRIELRQQKNRHAIFRGIIKSEEKFHISICNPPFHTSAQEANKGTLRKLSNLKGKRVNKVALNFGGKNNELWCDGGEKAFVLKMITESRQFAKSVNWFSSLISKEANLPIIYKALQQSNATRIETINMEQGNKKSRIIAWSFR